jgi:hypothetical protein
MKDFEKAEEEEEEKIRVEVGFFAHFFISERFSRLVSSRDVLNWIFHLSSSSLFREEHSMRLTRLSLSLLLLFLSKRTTALRTRRVGKSGVRRDAEMVWTGTFYVIF